jgi:SAM-dependent methyltransferase
VTNDDERHNRAFWDRDADAYQAAHGELLRDAPAAWGAWRIPERTIGALGDVAGLDMLELGCGAAQWSIALHRLGARAVGLDLSGAQLRHARDDQRAASVSFPLVLGNGEAIPLRDGAFDVVFCDHGAMSFCDPDRTLPEVARVLRPGGRLVFCHSTPMLYLTYDPDADRQTTALQSGRLPAPLRRVDPAVPCARLHRRGPGGAPTAEGRDDHLHRLRPVRVGPALARRADLDAHEALTRETVAGVSGART